MVGLPKFLNNPRVTSEILLAANEDDGQTATEVLDFGNPLGWVESQEKGIETAATNLLLNVVQRIRRVNGETDENDMGVWVAEWAKPVVVFLAGGIPQGKFDVFPVDLYICNVVLKHGRYVDLVNHGIVKFEERAKMRIQTSGKVPFEKTINRQVWGGQVNKARSREGE